MDCNYWSIALLKMNEQEREFYSRIDNILYKDWNPIGFPIPRDEYQSYVPKIFKVAMKRDEVGIAKELYELEIDNIGQGDYNSCSHIARLIMEEQFKIFRP